MKLRNKETGEVIDLDIANIKAQYGGISVIPEPVKLGGVEYVYYSLDGLVHEWEDYNPKEPLIDNEEIRGIIRAWAKANDATKLKYNYDENSLDDIYRNSITFNYGLGLKDGHTYTIPELCGEEEAPEPIEPMFIDLDGRIKEKGKE